MKTQATLLSVTALALVAYLAREALWNHFTPWADRAETHSGFQSVASPTAVAGAKQGFGPIFETVLPGPASGGTTALLDLETGRWMTLPDYAQPNSSADAIMAWVRTNRLDISGQVWPGGGACVTYNMTVVPVEARCWDDMTAEQLLGNEALSTPARAPRRQLVLGHRRADTYLFRTVEGSLGILRLAGLRSDGHGVTIQYKLVERQRSCFRQRRQFDGSAIGAINSGAQGTRVWRASISLGWNDCAPNIAMA